MAEDQKSEGAPQRRTRILRAVQAIADQLREIPSGHSVGVAANLPTSNNERSIWVKVVVRVQRKSREKGYASRLRWIRGMLAWWMGAGQRMTSGGRVVGGQEGAHDLR